MYQLPHNCEITVKISQRGRVKMQAYLIVKAEPTSTSMSAQWHTSLIMGAEGEEQEKK